MRRKPLFLDYISINKIDPQKIKISKLKIGIVKGCKISNCDLEIDQLYYEEKQLKCLVPNNTLKKIFTKNKFDIAGLQL